MEPQTATYYRAILFEDSTTLEKIPESLVKLHYWAVRRQSVLGLGAMIPKQMALTIVMTWMSSTKEGRAFTRDNTTLGDLFTTVDDEVEDDSDDDVILSSDEWDSLPAESPVVVLMKDNSTRDGQFLRRRGTYVDVRIDGVEKPVRINKVRIPAGV